MIDLSNITSSPFARISEYCCCDKKLPVGRILPTLVDEKEMKMRLQRSGEIWAAATRLSETDAKGTLHNDADPSSSQAFAHHLYVQLDLAQSVRRECKLGEGMNDTFSPR